MTIRECGLKDLTVVKQICEKTFMETFGEENSEDDMKKYLQETFSEEVLKKELEEEDSLYFLVFMEERPVGYMKLNFREAQTEKGHEEAMEVQRIYVLRDMKGKGIGKMMLTKAMDIGKERNLQYVWLGVWEHNKAAIAFYEKLGFRQFDTHVFVLGEDRQIDHLMKRSL
ncbi:GNAT family N-acetyltransferase [Proteiniclasticum sp. C24MP]|uniref:GNAT family N-acetyltransferase n=1 Tax=Proteiniclasticum sp. C24MP TaxID=3374101 RepID=UPI003754FE37